MTSKHRRYHAYKTQIVTEYLGVIETDENIREATLKTVKFFDVNKSVITLCDDCKRNAVFSGRPRVFLNEIVDTEPVDNSNSKDVDPVGSDHVRIDKVMK